MGDVKLMTVMALALGWFSVILPIVALGITFLAAGVVATAMVMFKKLAAGSSMPLGPYLLVGFIGTLTLVV